jgi:hypothetical protein
MLPAEKRLELVAHDLAANSGSRAAYIMRLVQKGGGFRPATLRKWTTEQLAREVVRRGAETLQDEIGYLQLLYVELEPAFQVEFLESAGVAHENGVIADDAEPPLAAASKVTAAADALAAKHGDRGLHYLHTIATYNPEAWPGLGEWLTVRAAG